MAHHKLAVFDLDGTLMDTSAGLIAAFREALESNGLPCPEDSLLLTAIGPPFYQFLRTHYTGLEEGEVVRINNEFRDIYSQDEYLFQARPYDGIYEVWEALGQAGVATAVATNKRQDYAEKLLCHFGFDRYTGYLYGTDFQNQMKKPDVIRCCLSAAGVKREQAVMIGDTANDAEGAQTLGVAFIGVLYGFGFRTEQEIEKYGHALGSAGKTTDILNLLIGGKDND